jgi:hypothetical protein
MLPRRLSYFRPLASGLTLGAFFIGFSATASAQPVPLPASTAAADANALPTGNPAGAPPLPAPAAPPPVAPAIAAPAPDAKSGSAAASASAAAVPRIQTVPAPAGLPTSYHGIPIIYTAAPRPASGAAVETPIAPGKSRREWLIALNTLGFFDRFALRPFFEFAIEHKLSDRFGVGGIVGFGGSQERWLRYELGPQVTAYPFGNYHTGMQLAADLTLLGENGSVEGTPNKIVRRSLTLAATVGYKYEATNGFTFSAALGARVRSTRATITGDAFSTSAASTYFDPVLRCHLGYSF